MNFIQLTTVDARDPDDQNKDFAIFLAAGEVRAVTWCRQNPGLTEIHMAGIGPLVVREAVPMVLARLKKNGGDAYERAKEALAQLHEQKEG